MRCRGCNENFEECGCCPMCGSSSGHLYDGHPSDGHGPLKPNSDKSDGVLRRLREMGIVARCTDPDTAWAKVTLSVDDMLKLLR